MKAHGILNVSGMNAQIHVSAAAAPWAAIALTKKLGPGKTVVTILPDTAECYFSTPLFDESFSKTGRAYAFPVFVVF